MRMAEAGTPSTVRVFAIAVARLSARCSPAAVRTGAKPIAAIGNAPRLATSTASAARSCRETIARPGTKATGTGGCSTSGTATGFGFGATPPAGAANAFCL